MMGFKRRWVVLLLLMTIFTVAVTSTMRAQFSQPLALITAKQTIPASLFGMHVEHSGTTWPNVPFRGWRLWDAGVTWGSLEPQQGAWKFEQLDRYVALATTKKVEILLTLGQTPRWASARPNDESPYENPGWPAEPAQLKDWRNYIRTVATRYKGKIHYYEIWNEPDLKQFYTGSVDKMVELAREAYTIIKQVDNTSIVLSPGATNGTPDFKWQKSFFRQGGGKYADVIAQHFYPQTLTSLPEELADYIGQIKAIMAEFGLSGKPLWNTEAGWLKPFKFQSDRQAMAYVARSYLINWASGVQRLYWYAWDNKYAVSLFFTQSDAKTPTPITKSYAQIYKWMVGAQLQQCKPNADKTWICDLSRQGRPFWIVWNSERELTFTVPKNWKIRKIQDLTGKNTALSTSRQIPIDLAPVRLSRSTSP